MRRRRLLILTGLFLALTALAPALADARGGGGSFNFSGGDDSSGGGGGGGGKGFAIYIALRLLLDLVIWGHGVGAVIAICLVIAAYLYFYGGRKVQDWWQAQRQRGPARRREAKLRQRRVELAAAEATDNGDEAFAPDRVRAAAERLFIDVQSAWSANDIATLRTLVAPRLMAEWERRLDDLRRRGLTNHVELTRPPQVQYIGIGVGARRVAATPGAGADAPTGPDRVVVRIEARIRDWVTDASGREHNERGAATKTVRMREYWTLERNPAATQAATTATQPAGASDDHGLGAEFDLSTGSRTPAGNPPNDWRLASIEQGAEGAHQLEARIVQTECADTQALQDEALVEHADSDAVDAAEIPALTNTRTAIDQDAENRARDLSLADGRFAPDILEVAARRAVGAWAQAIDGDPMPLLALADTDAVEQMLHPAGPGSRLVVRGPEIERISILALDTASTPATMTIDVRISGRRYLQDRATMQIVAGSDIHAATFVERWTLALSGDAANPWQIVSTVSPALSR